MTSRNQMPLSHKNLIKLLLFNQNIPLYLSMNCSFRNLNPSSHQNRSKQPNSRPKYLGYSSTLLLLHSLILTLTLILILLLLPIQQLLLQLHHQHQMIISRSQHSNKFSNKTQNLRQRHHRKITHHRCRFHSILLFSRTISEHSNFNY